MDGIDSELECRARELLAYLDTDSQSQKACRLPSAFWSKNAGRSFCEGRANAGACAPLPDIP